MKYTEFLSSAKRHSYSCMMIQNNIESYGEATAFDEDTKSLVVTLYYLAGYIIECSLKFKIFEAIGYDSNTEIDFAVVKNDFQLPYKDIKVHKLSTLQNTLTSQVSDISHESNNLSINDLLENWTPEIRYEHRDLHYQDIKAFYNHTKDFMRRM